MTITYDIMQQVADEFVPVKKQIDEQHPNNPTQRMLKYQTGFRNLMRKYQRKIQEKYNISMNEYNQDAAIYKLKIEKYLESHPEEKEKYESIKDQIKLSLDKEEEGEKAKNSKPSRFPYGREKY